MARCIVEEQGVKYVLSTSDKLRIGDRAYHAERGVFIVTREDEEGFKVLSSEKVVDL